jgi:predicted GIY-YIG superfamily endonuclease
MFEECYGLFGMKVLYFLLVEPGFYKFGITEHIYLRLQTHARQLKFIAIVRIFKCATRNSAFRVEQKFKKYAAAEGILVRKYGQTEIVNTNNPQKYLDWLEQEICADTAAIDVLALDDVEFAERVPRMRLRVPGVRLPERLIRNIARRYYRGNNKPVVIPRVRTDNAVVVKMDAREFKCDKCGLTFTAQKYLDQHNKRKTQCGILQAVEADHRCNYCNRVYSNKYNLAKHSRKCRVKNARVEVLPVQDRVLALEEHVRELMKMYQKEKEEREREQEERKRERDECIKEKEMHEKQLTEYYMLARKTLSICRDLKYDSEHTRKIQTIISSLSEV